MILSYFDGFLLTDKKVLMNTWMEWVKLLRVKKSQVFLLFNLFYVLIVKISLDHVIKLKYVFYIRITQQNKTLFS